MLILQMYFMLCHSVTKLCLTLWDPIDCSTSDSSALHDLLEFAQIHVCWAGDANHLILCCPLLLLPSIFLSTSLFQWVGSLHQEAKVLELQLQHQCFQLIFRTDLLSNGLVGYPCSPRDSQESSPTPQFKSINSLVLSFLCSPTLTSIHDYWKNPSFV